jgi:DnaK suppressor protein
MEVTQMHIEKIHFFRSLLMNDLHKLQMTAVKTSKEMKLVEPRPSDPIDMAVTELDQSIRLIFNNRERILIEEIRDALLRIDRGEFGVCQLCGEYISEKRLLVKPAGRLCIHCQEKDENTQQNSK